MYLFKLNEKETILLNEWKEAIKIVYGEYGIYEFKFIPNGIGVVCKVYSKLANIEKDITDYDSW